MKTLLASLALAVALPAAADDLKLPDPLVMNDGTKVTSAEQWRTKRRPEVLELFREHVYGRAPVGRPNFLTFQVTNTVEGAMDGKATLKQVVISYQSSGFLCTMANSNRVYLSVPTGPTGAINLILFTPNDAKKPVPCFLLICNRGAENMDPTREKKSPFWPAEQIIARGYAAAVFWNGDVAPDKKTGFTNGVHAIFEKPADRKGDSWGTLAGWAWGASRCLDYLETDKAVDAKRVAVVGHSRGGKTALVAGAEDERFAMTVSNDSGSSGAGLARMKNPKAETIRDITKNFSYWFCANYTNFVDREENLPVDQHQLAALIAPRLLYIASSSEDLWADPKREHLCAVKASPVFELLGVPGIKAGPTPAPESPIHDGHIGHHISLGKHDLNEYDWQRYMDFADRHLRAN